MGEQTTEKTSLSIKQFMIIFFLGLGYTVVYATPFIQYVFYDSLVDALQCTNQQLGYLITIFGVGNLLAPFGGALSDKFNTRSLLWYHKRYCKLYRFISVCVLLKQIFRYSGIKSSHYRLCGIRCGCSYLFGDSCS